MISAKTLCVVVNKPQSALAPSETFLRAHMTRLPFPTLSLVGGPGTRRTDLGSGSFLQSRFLIARAARAVAHRTFVSSVSSQDGRALKRYFRRKRVGVVLAEYGPTALTVARACSELNLPLITHFHGWDAYVLATETAQRDSYQALFDQSAAIVAVSRHMQRHLIALGAPAEKTIWNPCGAEPDPTPGDPATTPPVFLTVGRAAPKKATVVALLAFAQVLEKVPSARLELVGEHGDQVTQQLTRALGIQHATTFRGSLTHEQVLDLMRRSRCYVHPSVTAPDGDMEGTPVAVLEGMAAGLPIVSTRHGGIIDVLSNTTAGILLEEYDVRGTAAAMLEYAHDATRARRDGLEGRRLLQASWSMERSLAALSRVIDLASSGDHAGLAAMATA